MLFCNVIVCYKCAFGLNVIVCYTSDMNVIVCNVILRSKAKLLH